MQKKIVLQNYISLQRIIFKNCSLEADISKIEAKSFSSTAAVVNLGFFLKGHAILYLDAEQGSTMLLVSKIYEPSTMSYELLKTISIIILPWL